MATKIVEYNPKYFKEVLYSDDEQINKNVFKRNTLRIKLNNRHQKEYSFVLKNPSKAKEGTSDDTVNALIKYCHKYKNDDIGIITIFNVYPFYEPDSKVLYKAINQLSDAKFSNEMCANLEVIKQNTNDSSKLIVGFGKNPEKVTKQDHVRYVSDVLKILREKQTVHCIQTSQGDWSKDLFPFHPLMNGRLIDFIEYPHY